LLQIVILLYIAGGQRVRYGLFDPVAVAFCFKEEVELPVFFNDIGIDAGSIAGAYEELLRRSFQCGEVLIGIGVTDHVGSTGVFHGPVDHVFLFLFIVDRLGSPDPFQVFLPGVGLLDVDDGVRPVDQVVGSHQYHCPVGVPAIGRDHVCGDHVKCPAAGASQYVGVPDAACRADGVGGDDGSVIIQGGVVIAVVAKREVYGFLFFFVPRKIYEEVGLVRRDLGFDGEDGKLNEQDEYCSH